MPNLSCRSCGRQLYTVTPLASLFADERRCPRCGSPLFDDRRETERRTQHRRKNPMDDPGPPPPPPPAKSPKSQKSDKAETAAKGQRRRTKPAPADTASGERRVSERRTTRRRERS